MEEEKAVAYYDELTRKGGGAARFKQGLGFTTASDGPPPRGSCLPSSSSFLSNFVRGSTPGKSKEFEKEAQLQNIQNKLKKKEKKDEDEIRVRVRVRDRSRSRSRSRERRRRSRSRERVRRRSRSRERERRSRERERRSRSRSRSRERVRRRSQSSRSRERKRSRSRSSDGGRRGRRERRRSRSRSGSPRDGRRLDRGGEYGRRDRKLVKEKERNGSGSGSGNVDYAKLIEGYDHMTPAERVKAKMKLQLSQTAQKDAKMGTGSGWERFDFDKDAPVDDEEITVGDDDAAIVKRINQSFRFSSLEAKKEDEIRSAHDEAMFGAPRPAPSHTSESEEEREDNKNETTHDVMVSSLINEKILAKQQGSWRDRARRNVG